MSNDETLRLKEVGNTSVGETIKWGIIDDTLRS